MKGLDWAVLVGTITFIVVYGVWRNRSQSTLESYLRGDNELRWPTIGLSIMATQASAITFLSMPGQAYEDGMRFVQFYFGLPLAMVFISVVIVPIYYRLRVYTAYEYLENRFDLKVRLFGALLFLVGRGLAAGITIYAPAIILSSVLGWSLNGTNLVIGVAVILYTVVGGTKAVSQTQKQQMVVIMLGMIAAFGVAIAALPDGVSLHEATSVAGALGRMNVVNLELDFSDRYNIWSGVLGGFFLSLSYFGTDQSQVQRYLSGRSVAESRLGLLFNGMLKIPMQFLILYIGVVVFMVYAFIMPPVFFNGPTLEATRAGAHGAEIADVEARWASTWEERRDHIRTFVAAEESGDPHRAAAARAALVASQGQLDVLRGEARDVIEAADPDAELKDSDYIFISFVLSFLPIGLVGLLVAVILSAAMSSTASELNALGSTTTIDFYKRAIRPGASPRETLLASKAFTVMWGALALSFAMFASLLDNLIQAVNILGSIFYGTVLGIFLVGFFITRVGANAVFFGALIAQATVVALFLWSDLGFLWYNVLGCAAVITASLVLEPLLGARRTR